MLLNVGCGDHYAEGWVNTDLHSDVRNGPRPDRVCSLLDLPFDDESADRVYCGHVLEHIALEDLPAALNEVFRVLVWHGLLMVVGPDVNLAWRHEPLLVDGVKFGGQRWDGDEHQWVATGDLTYGFIAAAGFAAWQLEVQDVSDQWPIVGRDPWQFAIAAIKE